MDIVRHNVLDHGFVELIDIMGDDQAIVDAARNSIQGEKVKAAQSNEGLIRYLMRHKHTTPIEMVETKWRCKMPIVVARQWIRHRTASVNEMSARYGELPAEYYVPEECDIQTQAKDNKQGRDAGEMPTAAAHRLRFEEEASSAFNLYRNRLDDGMARELARINLPLSAYTQWIWKIDLHNLLHFLCLRLHTHAQKEIRVYADPMFKELKKYVPVTCQAFEDYKLNNMDLSACDIRALQLMFSSSVASDSEIEALFPTKREYKEFLEKADVLSTTNQE